MKIERLKDGTYWATHTMPDGSIAAGYDESRAKAIQFCWETIGAKK